MATRTVESVRSTLQELKAKQGVLYGGHADAAFLLGLLDTAYAQQDALAAEIEAANLRCAQEKQKINGAVAEIKNRVSGARGELFAFIGTLPADSSPDPRRHYRQTLSIIAGKLQ